MFQLVKNGCVVSRHPNREGAKISSLRHIENGESVSWRGDEGLVGDQVVFRIDWAKPHPNDPE